jgi:hypothetical protein
MAGNDGAQLGVGMVGYSFMGAAHSQAWRTAPRFFDLPLDPRMRVLGGRNPEALAAAAERSDNPDEHYRYLYALGAFRDPALVDRGLALARLIAQGKTMSDLITPSVPNRVVLDAPVVTKDNVDQYIDLAFAS